MSEPTLYERYKILEHKADRYRRVCESRLTEIERLKAEIERLRAARDHYYRVAVWFTSNDPGTPVPEWCELAWSRGEPVCDVEAKSDE